MKIIYSTKPLRHVPRESHEIFIFGMLNSNSLTKDRESRMADIKKNLVRELLKEVGIGRNLIFSYPFCGLIDLEGKIFNLLNLLFF